MNWTGQGDPVLTPFIRLQLAFFATLTVVALGVLGFYYLRLPTVAGVGQYKLYADLPASGGLYRTANVTYRGVQIGKVTDVQPTERGARATMSIDDRYKIPANAVANVHSVSAIGEQYLDLVSAGNVTQYLADGQTITKGTVPDEVGPALDSANRGLAVLPKDRIDSLLSEASQAVGGLGPALQRLVDSTNNVVQDFRDNLGPVTDVIQHSGPVLNSQVASGDAIERWAANLNVIGAQVAEQDATLRNALQQAAPTADQLNSVFSGVQDSLPQTLANLEIVIDMLKRYHKSVEQALVSFPEEASQVAAGTIWPGEGIINVALGPIFAAIGASIAITPV